MSGESTQKHIDGLEAVSLLYLYLPVLIFILGYLRSGYAYPMAVLVIVGLFTAMAASRRISASVTPPSLRQDPRTPWTGWLNTAAFLAFLVAMLVWSGWGWGSKIGDYGKHQAMLRDLIEYPWPLAYENGPVDGQPKVLVAYLGFYLPAALVGRWLGWYPAWYAQLIWVVTGAWLAAKWFQRVIGTVKARYAFLFLGFGGLDIVGCCLLHGWPPDGMHLASNGTWLTMSLGQNLFLIAPSHLSGLCWCAHHVLPAWIATLMFLYYTIYPRSGHNLFFAAAPVPYWSAFSALGCLPFLAAAVVATRFRKGFSLQNLLVGPMAVLVFALYLRSNQATYERGFLWEYVSLLKIWPVLVLFYLVAFGGYLLFCPRMPENEATNKVQFFLGIAIACLLLMPLFHIGRFCDFPIKAMMPAIALLAACLAIALRNPILQDAGRVRGLAFLLILGLWPSATLIANQLSHTNGRILLPHIIESSHLNILARDEERRHPEEAGQLFGQADTIFWRYLARPVIYSGGQEEARDFQYLSEPSSLEGEQPPDRSQETEKTPEETSCPEGEASE